MAKVSPLAMASRFPSEDCPPESVATITVIPTTASPTASTLPLRQVSPSTSSPSRNAQGVAVYCRKTAAAAVVRVIAVRNSTFIAANAVAIGTSPGRQRIAERLRKGTRHSAANRARRQASVGPSISPIASDLTNRLVVLHSTAAATSSQRPRDAE